MEKKCKHCGSIYHASFKCFSVSKKPIERSSILTNRPSAKRSIESKEYDQAKREYLNTVDVCEFPGCESNILTIHHSEGRSGANYTDKSKFKALCPHHHSVCELDPTMAYVLGLSLSRTKSV